jgi:tetratricopeptide (TPR) repeat protein
MRALAILICAGLGLLSASTGFPLFRAISSPDTPGNQLARAESFLAQNRLPEADRILSELWTCNDDPLLSADILIRLADCRRLEGDLFSALNLYARYAVLFPNRPESCDAYRERASILTGLHRDEPALGDCAGALAIRYDSAAFRLRNELLLRLDRPDDALAFISDNTRLNPDDARTAYLDYLKDRLDRGITPKPVSDLDFPPDCPQYRVYRELQLSESILTWKLNRADSLVAELGPQAADATSELLSLMRQKHEILSSEYNPTMRDPYDQLVLEVMKGDLGELADTVDVERFAPAVKERMLFLRAFSFETASRYDDALAGYDDFLTAHPHSRLTREALWRKAQCLYRLRRLGEALTILNVQLGEEDNPIYAARQTRLTADILAERGDLRMAIRAYQDAVDKAGSQPTLRERPLMIAGAKQTLYPRMILIHLEMDNLSEAHRLLIELADSLPRVEGISLKRNRGDDRRMRHYLQALLNQAELKPSRAELKQVVDSRNADPVLAAEIEAAQAREIHDGPALEVALQRAWTTAGGQSARVLRLAGEYSETFPSGRFADDAQNARIDALIDLNRYSDALTALKTQSGHEDPDRTLARLIRIARDQSGFDLIGETLALTERFPAKRSRLVATLAGHCFQVRDYALVPDLSSRVSNDVTLEVLSARSLYAMNKLPAAIRKFAAITPGDLTPEARYEYAAALSRLGKFPDAAKLLANTPQDDVNARQLRLECLWRTHDHAYAAGKNALGTEWLPDIERFSAKDSLVYVLTPYDGITREMADIAAQLRDPVRGKDYAAQLAACELDYYDAFSEHPELADRIGLSNRIAYLYKKLERFDTLREWNHREDEQ